MMICIGPEDNQCNMKRKGGTIVPASERRPIGLAILLLELNEVFIKRLLNWEIAVSHSRL